MKLSQKLGLVFTALSLLLVVITFSTPGLYRLQIPKDKKVHTTQEVIKIKGGRSYHVIEPPSFSIPTVVTLSCGLWYFSACVPDYCDVHSYQHAKHTARHLDEELQGMDMEEIYNNIGDIAKFAMLEFQIEITASIVCMVVSMVTTVCYFRGHMLRRGVGLAAFINTLVAGVFLAVATGKCATLIIQSRVLLSSNFDFKMNTVTFSFPYGLLLSGLAAIFLFGSSLSLLLTLTDEKTRISDQMSKSLICNETPKTIPCNMVSPAEQSI
ncbi:uncharacterized protein LOC132563618 [Ylistrum balloti]|uniref:uncharacterized protein LOC132563618 n=1 Tax=Ylistrum balloti TaxID=509963 RepID=UPI0029059995|nr:uncharacterized protein LOC132563618 [Ylistrum balloti]